MKHFIKRKLQESLRNSYVIGSAIEDSYELSEEFDDNSIKNSVKSELDKLPENITLYRVLYVKNEGDINKKQPGSHYVMKKRDLERSHYQKSHVGGGEPLLITVKANKSMIDREETIKNRINYPHENEITLKNKGLGAKIIKIEPFESNDEDLIGSPDDFNFDFDF
jgi:mRNA-degrading endonuclease RelE of RelBE toxin-antitoxin system